MTTTTTSSSVGGPVARSAPERRDVDAREFWTWVWGSVEPVLGWIFLGLGVILMVLGWWGVSRNAIVAKQLPYLASGGIGGIALVVLGGRFLVIRDLRRDSGRLDRLEQMVLELHDVVLVRADVAGVRTPHVRRDGTAAGASAADMQFVVLPTGERYHRESCRVVQNKSKAKTASAAEVKRRGLQPCPLCEPLRDAS